MLPSFFHAPTANIIPSDDIETEIPLLSPSVSPSISEPSWGISVISTFFVITRD